MIPSWIEDFRGGCGKTVYHAIKKSYRRINSASEYGNKVATSRDIWRVLTKGIHTRSELWITKKVMEYVPQRSACASCVDQISLGTQCRKRWWVLDPSPCNLYDLRRNVVQSAQILWTDGNCTKQYQWDMQEERIFIRIEQFYFSEYQPNTFCCKDSLINFATRVW